MKDAITPILPSIPNGKTAPMAPRGGIYDPGPEQISASRTQRMAIVTLYSLAILLVFGYIPSLEFMLGLGL